MTVKLRCLFCFGEQFILVEEDPPQPGGQVLCATCGRSNDYDSLMRVARRKAIQFAENEAQKLIDEFAEQMRKRFTSGRRSSST